ncbi:C-C motif chemokine 15 isoform X2 [Microcebus murinus]|uniref:C-C motif chemokine 15 isoform X2 n=1 Tax=Microcebus murinus TaxID=30608 RepID=UPI003F6BD238
MKVSVAALVFLILAAALGSLARVIHDTETRELTMEKLQLGSSVMHHGFHRPADCCLSYTPRSIRCVFMRDYFVTSSGCSQPGVIFHTKKGKRVCADPNGEGVQDCMRKLTPYSISTGSRIIALS